MSQPHPPTPRPPASDPQPTGGKPMPADEPRMPSYGQNEAHYDPQPDEPKPED